MRLTFAPLALIVVSIAGVAALFALAPDDASPVSIATFIGGLLGYFVGTDWWLLRLGAAPVEDGHRTGRVAGIFALATPATLWFIGLSAAIVFEGDNMWMVLPYALAPGLLVWPFAISALRRLRVAPS